MIYINCQVAKIKINSAKKANIVSLLILVPFILAKYLVITKNFSTKLAKF